MIKNMLLSESLFNEADMEINELSAMDLADCSIYKGQKAIFKDSNYQDNAHASSVYNWFDEDLLDQYLNKECEIISVDDFGDCHSLEDCYCDIVFDDGTILHDISGEYLKPISDLDESYDGFNDWLEQKYGIGDTDLTDDDWELLHQEYLSETNQSDLIESYTIDDYSNWLSEHEQATEDIENYYHKDLANISEEELLNWIADHEELANDFENKFGKGIISESLNEDYDGPQVLQYSVDLEIPADEDGFVIASQLIGTTIDIGDYTVQIIDAGFGDDITDDYLKISDDWDSIDFAGDRIIGIDIDLLVPAEADYYEIEKKLQLTTLAEYPILGCQFEDNFTDRYDINDYLDESINNMPKDTTTITDPVMAKAVEDSDNIDKLIDDKNKEAIKELGITKADMKKIFTGSKTKDVPKPVNEDYDEKRFELLSEFNNDIYNAIAKVMFRYRNRNITKDELEQAIEFFEYHFETDDRF